MLLRHWRLVLVALVLVMAGTGYVATSVPLTYQAQGAVVLIPPSLSPAVAQQANNPALANPVLSFSQSLNIVASVTIRSLSDSTIAKGLRQEGATAPYKFGTGIDSTPLITVTAKSKHPAEAIKTVNVVIKGAQAELARQQALLNAPPSTFITAVVITHPDTVSSSWKARITDVAGVVAIGAAATLLAALALDRLARPKLTPVTDNHATGDIRSDPLPLRSLSLTRRSGAPGDSHAETGN